MSPSPASTRGLGKLARAFALATAVGLLEAVPHLWANDVRVAVVRWQ